MDESDVPRTEAAVSVVSPGNANPEVGNNSTKIREEGELSSSSDDGELPTASDSQFNATIAAQEEAVQIASLNKSAEGGKGSGSCVPTDNPKGFVDIPSTTSAQSNIQKSSDKNRGPFVPFVISFSDDDSGSDFEEFRQPKASEAKGNEMALDGNGALHDSSVPRSQTFRQSLRNRARVIPRKMSLSRTFISSVAKIDGANCWNGRRSLVNQRSHVKNFNIPNKKSAGREHGGNQNMRSELQDLRQQIAIKEKELKLKSIQKNKQTVSGASRDYNVTDWDNDATRNYRATSADNVPIRSKEPDKKRLRLSTAHSDEQQQMPPARSVVQLAKPELGNGGQQRANKPGRQVEETLGTSCTGAAQHNKQGADMIMNGSLCDRKVKRVDPSTSLQQAERAANVAAKAFPKKSSSVGLKHSSEPNCHDTRITNKATRRHNLGVGVEFPEVRSVEKASKPKLNDTHQGCILRAPDSNLEGSDASLNKAAHNCLDMVSILQDNNMDVPSLLAMEELHDKELEEAQEHRHKCEIEERNALKAYRNAQKALLDANARCARLYRNRELCSMHLRSLMMENSSLFLSSRPPDGTRAGLNSSNNVSDDNGHQLIPTSSHHMQAEFNVYDQQGHHPNIQTADGVSDQLADGQDFASNPCSEPDASTSEPHKDNRVADGVYSPSSDLNVSVYEREDAFQFDHGSVQIGPDYEKNDENYGERVTDANDEAKGKFSFDRPQDSLLLEATLRSQLFARLGTKTLSKKRGKTCNAERTDVTRAERGGSVGQEEMSMENVPLSEIENNRHYGSGGAGAAENSISELPVQIGNEDHVANLSSTYASPTVDPLDSCISAEGDQSSRSATFSCPILRSTFGHMKNAEPLSLVGLQSKNKLTDEVGINNVEGSSAGPAEIQPSNLSSTSFDEELMTVRAGNVGCYTCNLSIDPFWPLCMFELRGKCNDDECPLQHVKDYSRKIMNLHDDGDFQAGALIHRGKVYGETKTSLGVALAPPTYLVCLDMLKTDLHSYGSVVCSGGQCWKKCYSTALVLSSLLTSDLPTDEPFLHGTEARIDVHGSWNCQPSYFHSRNYKVTQLDQHVAANDQTIETALLNLNQEVDKRKGRIEALKVLARALDVHPSSAILWVVYLHLYYSSEKSIGKDDMFHYAVEHNEGSYELWLMYINSRTQLEDQLVAYDTALLALCRYASAVESDAVHASACILDLLFQLMNCLRISGNVGKAIEKIYGLLPSEKNSDGSQSLLLSDIFPCLTLYDKCIFWLCCVYFIVYKKLPDAIVQQFEFEKDFSDIEWPSGHLTVDEKQKAVKLMELAVESLALYIDCRPLEGESTLKAAHMFAVNHIRCMTVLEGIDCSRNLLDKYTKIYPSCLELVLMSARIPEDDFGDLSFVGFEEALRDWPEDVPGVQCIWNQYAEHALQNGRFDFVKELMNRWFHTVWQVQHSRYGIDSMDVENCLGSLELISALNLETWVTNFRGSDVAFGLLNLALHKSLQNDFLEARLAMDRAMKAVVAEDYKHFAREHAMFLLANGLHLEGGMLNLMKNYLVDVRAFPASQPLSRKFIQSIKKPRVQQLVSNLWSAVSSDFSLVNSVLEVWHGQSLLPQRFNKVKDLVDLVEDVMEINPSNYPLAMCVCKVLSRSIDLPNVNSASVSFWASSLLVNALFQVVPVAAEHVWAEAAGILHDLTDIQTISDSFHRRALAVYPFSIKLWNSYLNLSRITGNTNSVIEAARERGINLDN